MFDFDAYTNAPLFSIYARPVAYTPAERLKAPSAPLQGIFDREHETVLEELANSELTSSGHTTTVPVLTVRLAEFAAKPRVNDTVTIPAFKTAPAEGSFSVWDVRPDGEGCADLLLRKI